MELVVGASEATMKSVMGKLGGLLAQEYTLIRGVNGDLQYINDELASMQSFLRDLTAVGAGQAQTHGHRMKDWMKQIRDITYDIEDCIDDSAHRLHGLRSDMCCYYFANSVYEVLTWWPRRDVATKISVLKMRAQQIGERRERYGVNNPEAAGGSEGSHAGNSTAAGFDAADNQEASLELVAMKDPVGVEDHMKELEEWLTNDKNSSGVLYVVGFGGVGKTTIATKCSKPAEAYSAGSSEAPRHLRPSAAAPAPQRKHVVRRSWISSRKTLQNTLVTAELERLELRFSMLEGLYGVENLAGLKVVHLTLEDQDGEHMTKEVQHEVETAVKRRTDGKAPKIILDQ